MMEGAGEKRHDVHCRTGSLEILSFHLPLIYFDMYQLNTKPSYSLRADAERKFGYIHTLNAKIDILMQQKMR